jgi:hypothetical protein
MPTNSDFLANFRAKYGRPSEGSNISIAKAPKTALERPEPKAKAIKPVKVPRLSKADLDLVTQRASLKSVSELVRGAVSDALRAHGCPRLRLLEPPRLPGRSPYTRSERKPLLPTF